MAEPPTSPHQLDGIRLEVVVGPLAGPVLSRAVGVMAARAGLTLDRIDDAVLIADTLVTGIAGEVPDARIAVRLDSAPGCVVMRVGPLREGGASRLLHGSDDGVPGAQVIRALSSRARVTGGGRRNEYLVVELSQTP